MKYYIALVFVLCVFMPVLGQKDLQELVSTEKAFAAAAAAKGTKPAFLEFLAEDSVVFNPQRANGKEVWNARKPNLALLSWYPSYADISSNGKIGFTTGPWEYRPKGKDDAPVAFGHYVTVWERQHNGDFKAVLDIGIDHERQANAEAEFAVPGSAMPAGPKDNGYAGDAAARFFELVAAMGPKKAYKEFGANDMWFLRSGMPPVVGKKDALKYFDKESGKLVISKRMSFFGSDDFAYATNTYILTKADKTTETGNFVQIWKRRDKRWMIVLDIFVANPK